MARPIWNGTISFGLLHVPVQLMSAQRSVDLHFRMLDSRDQSPIRYERVNAETGEEVPWKEVVKAFEYEKGSYVVLDEADLKKAAPESTETVDIEAFVDADAIDAMYYEKPYYLVPGKKAEKAYVLLRETLRRTEKVGIAKVVIRTRQYLAMLAPRETALVLILLRFPQEIVSADEYSFPAGTAAAHRVSAKEVAMATQLVEAMSAEWNPDDYKDDFRDKLQKIIQERVTKEGGKLRRLRAAEKLPDDAATNVVDFMALLEKSLGQGKRAQTKVTKKRATRSRARTVGASARRAQK
ncbi:Ku protein [Tahibacter amnicola]|uniref:Non-homologous end joining protein Ku n=1 Tax=Tahibacter amnicola TaxID=2976241 RepID=A0ABY6BG32_9GAMM|nr:Ku protein [Tahibacter amnicola]UXI68988.1 Ku protein [Tahibacter amnicola]